MSSELIGWALGPGQNEDHFKFATTKVQKLKVGEFVYYEPDDRDVKILCRVAKREELNPKDPTSNIISKLEGEIDEQEMVKVKNDRGYLVKVKVLGVYDFNYGGFRNLRDPPSIGHNVYYAESDMLSKIFSSSQKQGILHVGRVLNREENEVNVFVNMDEVATKHLSVLASTGAGKSYTVGVLLEEFVKPGNRGASFVFDIHGEYYTMAEDDEFGDRFNLVEEPKVKISNLTIEDFNVAFTQDMTNVQSERLREVLDDLDIADQSSGDISRDNVRLNYDIDDIIDRLNAGNRVDDNLAWRLRLLKDFVSLEKEKETNVEQLFEPGKCNIIEFPTGAEENERNLIMWYMTRRILKSRKTAIRKKREGKSTQGHISTPVTIVTEEAHNFAPADRHVETRDLLQEIAREGRKFGVGLCVISQRPSKLDEDVLSQCNSSIIMKVRNGVDQQTVAESVESAGEDLLKDLPGLTTGQAILTGDFINTPVIAKIRMRQTEHGGRTPDVAKESIKKYKQAEQKKKSKQKDNEEKD